MSVQRCDARQDAELRYTVLHVVPRDMARKGA